MPNQLIPPPELAPPSLSHLPLAKRIELWAALIDEGEAMLRANLRAMTGSEEEFRAGKRLYVENVDDTARLRALRHARVDRDRGYNLLTNNCEHTVTRAVTGTGRSPQLASWAAGIGVAALALVVTRHPGIAAAGYALGRGLVRGRLGNGER